MSESFAQILKRLPEYTNAIRRLEDILLTNLVMVAEIPSPTFGEQRRVQWALDRFTEYRLEHCSIDEAGNALAILPGRCADRNLLVVAHLDTPVDENLDHTVTVQPGLVSGVGLADNSLGVAALVTLPLVLSGLGLELESNLILMGSTRALGRGDLGGTRFFLNNTELAINAGLCLEGVRLGRLSYATIGMLRGVIRYRLPDEYDWTRFGAGGAIVSMNDIITRILEIPLPRRPRSAVVMSSIEGGGPGSKVPTHAELQLEVRSDSGEIVADLHRKIANIASEVASLGGGEASLEVIARRRPGGLEFSHPLPERARDILNALGLPPRISPSTAELSAFVDREIPALRVGLTSGEDLDEEREQLEVAPIASGMAQVIALLQAIDQGYCDRG